MPNIKKIPKYPFFELLNLRNYWVSLVLLGLAKVGFLQPLLDGALLSNQGFSSYKPLNMRVPKNKEVNTAFR
jgi:hypothetical protein